MKQRKLIQKLYKACFDHDTETIAKLREKEFAKILKQNQLPFIVPQFIETPTLKFAWNCKTF